MSSTQPWRLSACPTTDRRGSSAARSPERSRTPATRRRRAHQFVVDDAPSTKRDEARPCGIEDVSFAVGHGRFSLVPASSPRPSTRRVGSSPYFEHP